MAFVITTIEDSIGTIMFNHPQKRNALSQPFIADILEALGAFRQQNLRVIILRAQEGATVWSAGHDVSELPQGHRDPLGWDDPLRRLGRVRRLGDAWDEAYAVYILGVAATERKDWAAGLSFGAGGQPRSTS